MMKKLQIKIANKKIVVSRLNGKFVLNGWITVKKNHDNEEEKGRHLFIGEGETPAQAMKRQWGVDLEGKKETPQIEEHTNRRNEKNISAYKKKTLEQQQKLDELNQKKEIARKIYLEEDDKFIDFAKKKGLTLTEAKKIYPSIKELKAKTDDFQKLIDESIEFRKSTIDELSKSIRDEIENYNSNTNKLVEEFDKIPDLTKEYTDKLAELRKEREEIYRRESSGEIDKKTSLALFLENTATIHDVKEKEQIARAQQLEENIKILNKKDTNFKLKSQTTNMAEMSNKLKYALDGFIGDGVVPSNAVVSMNRIKKGARAFAKEDTINLNEGDTVDVAIHEYMHFIEKNNPRLLANSLAFAKSRTEGEKTKSLATITGMRSYKGEYAKKDKFFDPYCGRVYSIDQEYNTANASEILSMGMQRLFTEPKKFAQEDREYFNFCIASIKGDL